MQFSIERDFRGEPLPRSEHTQVEARLVGNELLVDVAAPYFGDPSPSVPLGVCDGLWDYEVVELFLANGGDHYLEIELGPHGHHLVIELQGVRRKRRVGLPIAYVADIAAGRFVGHARIPRDYLTMEITRANAFAIHGVGDARRYSAHAPMGGERPDFHALGSYVPCVL